MKEKQKHIKRNRNPRKLCMAGTALLVMLVITVYGVASRAFAYETVTWSGDFTPARREWSYSTNSYADVSTTGFSERVWMGNQSLHGFGRSVVSLISVVALLFSVFTLNVASGYRSTTLDDKLGYVTGNVSVEELVSTTEYTVDKLNSLADSVNFTANGSIRSYTHGDTVKKAYMSYNKLSEKYGFINNFSAPVKRLAVSPLMTYTHISGIYTFFTGEANLNTNYPEYINVFTVAHEMAHQRGIARENEANFIAYLVCTESDDVYMQYSGHLNMFEYLVSALYKVSPKDANKMYSKLDNRVYRELVSYGEFFEKYNDSTASEVAGTVNDIYLQSQGTPGTQSYGMVVDLAVEHLKRIGNGN